VADKEGEGNARRVAGAAEVDSREASEKHATGLSGRLSGRENRATCGRLYLPLRVVTNLIREKNE
jgi:hypothetical protein